MNKLDELLSPEHLDLLIRLLEVRDANGVVVVEAGTMAYRILKGVVTEDGKLDPSVQTKLGGDPSFGRATLVSALASALVGSEPVPEAWIEAAASGFAGFKPVTYGTPGKEKGSAGVFLQRMLAAWRGAANSGRASSPPILATRSELAILIVVMLIRQLQRATASRLALGPAWAIMKAVDRLPMLVKKRIDALADNEEFLAAVGKAVAEVVDKCLDVPATGRTNKQVEASLPEATNVTKFFADRTLAKRELIEESIAQYESADYMFAAPPADTTDALLHEMINSVVFRRQTAEIAKATAYLEFDWRMKPTDLREQHLERVTYIMPSLDPDLPPNHRTRRVLALARSLVRTPIFTGTDDADYVFGMLVQSIRYFARNNGPPPPETPLEHYPYFEAFACYHSLQPSEPWPARDLWGSLGTTSLEQDPDATEWLAAFADGDISVIMLG